VQQFFGASEKSIPRPAAGDVNAGYVLKSMHMHACNKTKFPFSSLTYIKIKEKRTKWYARRITRIPGMSGTNSGPRRRADLAVSLPGGFISPDPDEVCS
jgi:hypothetical protein